MSYVAWKFELNSSSCQILCKLDVMGIEQNTYTQYIHSHKKEDEEE